MKKERNFKKSKELKIHNLPKFYIRILIKFFKFYIPIIIIDINHLIVII